MFNNNSNRRHNCPTAIFMLFPLQTAHQNKLTVSVLNDRAITDFKAGLCTSRMSATNRLTHMTDEVNHQDTKYTFDHLKTTRISVIMQKCIDDNIAETKNNIAPGAVALLIGVSCVSVHKDLPVIHHHHVIQKN